MQEMGATAQFIASLLDIKGPVYGISTACSSGAKALAAARRLIRAGLCDAVIAGGVDTLCQLTVRGFSSLEAVSASRSNPFSKNRQGINIGEGAALFLVTSEVRGVEISGVGEGSDAYHISAPEPSGAGAVRCMTKALNDAGVVAADVDYVNLHGTATTLNDQMESQAIKEVFGLDTLCSSTKPFTGHTLGAAGAIEAGICWLTIQASDGDFLPVHIWDGVRDPELPSINLVSADSRLDKPLNYVLSNTFAFGGNNISLLLGRIQ
jgi:3-oxoacyl-[acyl-carrier-protein] synthase-1